MLLPGLALDHYFPPSASRVAGIIDVNHHTQFICWDGEGGLTNFILGLVSNLYLTISAFQVAGITGMNHHIWPENIVFKWKGNDIKAVSSLFYTAMF
jgi:hypothetical protein